MWATPLRGLTNQGFSAVLLGGMILEEQLAGLTVRHTFGPWVPKRHQLVTDIGEVPVMEKMQDPKMCWAFPLPGRGVVVAVYPSHALISLQ